MTGMKGSSFGRAGGCDRRYPGGTECSRIFRTVFRLILKTRAASLLLIPSAWHALCTRLYRSTEHISPPSARCLKRKVRTLTPPRSDQPTVSADQFASGIHIPRASPGDAPHPDGEHRAGRTGARSPSRSSGHRPSPRFRMASGQRHDWPWQRRLAMQGSTTSALLRLVVYASMISSSVILTAVTPGTSSI